MKVIEIDLDKRSPEYGRMLCEELERGNILVLRPSPFAPSDADAGYLRDQKGTGGATHKNIAYKPSLEQITGTPEQGENRERLLQILGDYSRGALQCLASLFPGYSQAWRVDYASFRPVEEQGRDLPLSKRNDLMHVDAFPSRPTYGGRILRAFTNIHPTRDRVWGTSDAFEVLAQQYAVQAGLLKLTGPLSEARRVAVGALGKMGLKTPRRSAYDEFMLRFHHFLKACDEFQKSGLRDSTAFGPGATWICFTDHIAHAALSGQFALEQTCIVPFSAMLLPDISPLRQLEKLAGCDLVPRHVLATTAAAA